MSANCADFEFLREFYADRLQHRMDPSTLAAQGAGMPPTILDSLQADESWNCLDCLPFRVISQTNGDSLPQKEDSGHV